MTVPFTFSGDTMSVLIKGQPHVIDRSHINFDAIKDQLRAGEATEDSLAPLFDVRQGIREKVASFGDVEVGHSCVLYKGQPVHNHLTERMLAILGEGFDIEPWAWFMDKLMQNPSATAVRELYLWLEKGNLPLTKGGNFIAYKKVRNDYGSHYDNGRTMNRIGTRVEMPRNQVDDQRENTCSFGLHFCSYSYLPAYMGSSGRVVILEIDPADVVSIPSDYDNAKGRACGYWVVGEVDRDKAQFAFQGPVYDPDEDESGFTIGDVTEFLIEDLDVPGEMIDRGSNLWLHLDVSAIALLDAVRGRPNFPAMSPAEAESIDTVQDLLEWLQSNG